MDADTDLEAQIQIKEALAKHARVMARTRDPKLRIAASQEEIRLAREIEELRNEQTKQGELVALVPAAARG